MINLNIFSILKHFFKKILFLKYPPFIESKNISLFSSTEGFKFFYKNNELTKNIGLNCSFESNDNFFDSSKFKQKIILWTHKSFNILKYDENNNYKIFFHIFIISKNLFSIKIKIKTLFRIKNFKIHLMIDNNYKSWISGIHEGSFPVIKTWSIIGTPIKDPPFIGAYTLDVNNENFSLLPVIFSFYNLNHSIENTSIDINARILSATFDNEINSNFEFQGEVVFFESKNEFNNFLNLKRNEFLTKNIFTKII